MGRIIKNENIGFRCELTKCPNQHLYATPKPAKESWLLHLEDLAAVVAAGWGLVLNNQIRAYCPEHAELIWNCTCATHPDREHLCPVHNDSAEQKIWVGNIVPEEVTALLNQNRHNH